MRQLRPRRKPGEFDGEFAHCMRTDGRAVQENEPFGKIFFFFF